MKKTLFALVLSPLLCGAAFAADLPELDSEAYCKTMSDLVASSSGDANAFSVVCKDGEEVALRDLSMLWGRLSDPQKKECETMARAAGGGYDVLASCADDYLNGGFRKIEE